MKHILPFPDFSLENRNVFLAKLMAGVLVQEAPRGWQGDPGDPASQDHWSLFPCWLYAGKWEDGKGYKKVRFQGRVYYVHRAIYCLMVAVVSPEHLVDHLCKNHGCCQPRHLEAVPPVENILRGDNQNAMLRGTVTGRVSSYVPNFGPVPSSLAAVKDEAPLLVDTDFSEIEKRALAHCGGLEWRRVYEDATQVVYDDGGDVPKEAWDTPSLLQAHIDHGHPRFRAPMGTPVAGTPRRVKYEFGVEADPPAPKEGNLIDVSVPPARRSWLPRRLALFLSWFRRGQCYVPPRPPRDMGEW